MGRQSPWSPRTPGTRPPFRPRPAVIVPAEATAQRIAGGWDLDRIYVDFNTGFVEAFQRPPSADYKKKSQTYFINGHAAITGPPAIPAADGIMDDATDLGAAGRPGRRRSRPIVAFLIGNGANVSFIAMAGDVFADFLTLTSADVPVVAGRNQGPCHLNGDRDRGRRHRGRVDPVWPAGDHRWVVTGTPCPLWETGPINVHGDQPARTAVSTSACSATGRSWSTTTTAWRSAPCHRHRRRHRRPDREEEPAAARDLAGPERRRRVAPAATCRGPRSTTRAGPGLCA